MSIIICGIPKNDQGDFYCPWCGFTSDDIERFATSCCWECVFNYEEEEKVAPTINDVKVGDTLKVTRTFEVSRVDTWDGIVLAKGGGRIRLKASNFSEAPVYSFEIVKTAVSLTPEHWPPQKDDVWEVAGRHYHMVYDYYGENKLKALHASDGSVTVSSIKKPEAKLVYRKGNVLK